MRGDLSLEKEKKSTVTDMGKHNVNWKISELRKAVLLQPALGQTLDRAICEFVRVF